MCEVNTSMAGWSTKTAGRWVTCVVVLLLFCVALNGSTAGAAPPSHPPLPTLTKLGFSSPCGVATDSVGNYYVVDSALSGPTAKSISIYSPTGAPITSFSTASFSTLGLCKIAVDSSGRIYTTNSARGEARRLKPEGAGYPPTSGTTYALDTSLNGNGTLVLGSSAGVAVDPTTQNVYVSSKAGNEIQEFLKPGENYALRFNGEETTTPALTSSSTCEDVQSAMQDKFGAVNVGVGEGVPAGRCRITFMGSFANTDVGAVEVIKAGGNVNAFQMFNGSASAHVTSFQPDGTPISNTIGASIAGAEYIGVDVSGKNGNVYVADKAHNKAYVLNSAGNTVLASFDGSDSIGGAFDFSNPAQPGLASDQSDGHVYVSSIKAHGVVAEFDAAGNFVSELSHTPSFEEATGGNGIAVDNGATSPGKGRIYFTARTEAGANRGIFAYGPASPPSHAFLGTLTKLGFSSPCGVATDSVGNYYVVDSALSGPTAKSISIYSPTGAPITSFSTASFSTLGLCKIAVDSSGRIYTTNSARGEARRLKPEGAGYPPTSGTTYALDTSLNGNGTLVLGSSAGVAVDPTTQNVYVSSKAGNEIQEFLKPGENYALRFNGEETTTPALTSSSTCEDVQSAMQDKFGAVNVGVGEGVPAGRCRITFMGSFANTDVGAVEVIKAGGNVNAFQMFNGSASAHVTSFQPDGTPISNTIGASIAGAEYIGVDVSGKNGNVYVADKAHNKAYVLNSAGNTVLASFDGSDSIGGAFDFSNPAQPGLASDQSDGHVYVSSIKAHGVVAEFDAAGNFVSELSHTPSFEEATGGNGIAVDNGATSPGKGRIYFTARTEAGANRGIFAYGPLIYGFPLSVAKTGLGSGTVVSTPAGIECGTTCDAEFEAGSSVTLSAEAAVGSKLGAWSGCDQVTNDQCEVAMSQAQAVNVRFDVRPVVTEETASRITSSSADLEAKVNPEGKETSYSVEYITANALKENEENAEPAFAGASKAPASPVAIGNDVSPVPVAIKVNGLKPATTYRFRFVAGNDIGTVEGERKVGTDEEISRSFTTFALPQVFSGQCPANESFRIGPSAKLPDCRAYEQASPIDKNGGSLQATAPFTRTSVDGSTITFESTTGVPGGSGSQNFPTYMAKRETTSWATTGLLPSPSSGERARVLGWTPSFGTVFDLAERFGSGVSMLARSTANGAETEIAPHTLPNPEYTYIGSSDEGDTTIFEAKPVEASKPVQLTPDAAADKSNVYAWSESAGLHLAGILPDGSTPSQGSRATQGSVGEAYNQDSHLVTADGSVFFNDAGDGQLYLRLNPTAEETTATDGDGNCIPDAVHACTVHISASKKTNGKGPNGTDAAGAQPAYLKAASADGSLVTFTSSEKLTEDANTGPEPDAPSIARAKASDGTGKNLGFISAFANEIAIDEAEGFVYWTDPIHKKIGRAKLDGSSVNADFIDVPGEPRGIAVIDKPSAKYIYWTDRGALNDKGESQSGFGSIGRVDTDGSDLSPVCYSGLTNPRSIAANDTNIYWTIPDTNTDQGEGDVGRADLLCENEGGTKDPTFLTDFRTNGDIAVLGSNIYTSGYLSELSLGLIQRFTLDGTREICSGTETTGVNSPFGLAASGSKLYWVDRAHQAIGQADLECNNQEPNFITGAGRAEDLGVGGEGLLWTTNQVQAPNPGADIYQLDRSTEALTDLAPDTSHANGTEVLGVLGASEDGSYVYFAANGVPDGVGNSPNGMNEIAELGNCRGALFSAKGTCNLYVAHGGEVDFISHLNAAGPGVEKDSGDVVDWVAGRTDLERAPSDRSARVSSNGRVLVFRSSRELTKYDNQGPRCVLNGASERVFGRCLEFYRFDAQDESLTCLTCDPRGTAPVGPARLASLQPPNVGAPKAAATLARNLSSDGNRFFFESEDALVAEDVNGQGGCLPEGACQDVYEWEASGSGSCEESSPAYSSLNGGCIYLISTGESKEATFFGDADLRGENVFIFTYAQLVPQDKDALFDVYDVRVGGGLSSQHQVEQPPCGGEACKPQPTSPPATQSPGSANFSGPTDQKPQRTHQKKHKKQKHGKHRRKGKGKAKHKRRAAKQSGRASR